MTQSMEEKAQSGYFEGTLQIRSKSDAVLRVAIAFIEKKLPTKKDLFISKIVEYKQGADLYMTNNRRMKSLGVELRDELGGDISFHPRLFSKNRQSGKEIYRLTARLELPHFMKGDVIIYHDEPHLVLSLSKKIKAEQLRTGKKTTLSYDSSLKKLDVQQTTVLRIKPSVEVMHPETFQAEELANTPKEPVKINAQVPIVMYKDAIFLV